MYSVLPLPFYLDFLFFLLIYLPLTCLLEIDRLRGRLKVAGSWRGDLVADVGVASYAAELSINQSINQSRKSVMLVDKHRQVVYST